MMGVFILVILWQWRIVRTILEYSRELCGGPHVANMADLAKFGKFKIKKESSSSAGVRRVKAVFVHATE